MSTTPLMPHGAPVEKLPAEERLCRKQRLAAAFRLFGRFGFDEGVAGHITARDPERLDHFWVNPFGRSFKQIRRQRPDPRQPRRRGRRGRRAGQPGGVRHPLAGARGPPRRGRRRALALGLRQGVVVAAARARPAHPGRVRLLRATTRCSTTTPASCSTSRRASASPHALGDNKAVILRNHGLLTVGHSVDEAVWWFITMERTCQAQLLAEAAGDPVLHRPTTWPASPTAGRAHTSPGWFSFQPLFDWILASSPTCSTDPPTAPPPPDLPVRPIRQEPKALTVSTDADLRQQRETCLRAHLAAEREADTEGIIATFAHPRYELVGAGRVYDGPDEVRRYFQDRHRVFPDLGTDVISFWHSDDVVAAELWLTGTYADRAVERPPLPVPHRLLLRVRRRRPGRRPRLLRHRHHRPAARLAAHRLTGRSSSGSNGP